jgi:hypothetical protein
MSAQHQWMRQLNAVLIMSPQSFPDMLGICSAHDSCGQIMPVETAGHDNTVEICDKSVLLSSCSMIVCGDAIDAFMRIAACQTLRDQHLTVWY